MFFIFEIFFVRTIKWKKWNLKINSKWNKKENLNRKKETKTGIKPKIRNENGKNQNKLEIKLEGATPC